MTHRQRIEAALAKKKTDRPPLGFWMHFPNDDRHPRVLADTMIDLAREMDLDFIKFMPYGLYSVVDWGVRVKVFDGVLDPPVERERAIRTPEDWTRLKPLKGTSGEYAVVLEAQRICLNELKASGMDLPLVQTVFSPLTSAVKMAGLETLLDHLRNHPDKVWQGLQVITETTVQFAREAVGRGADGLFMGNQMSRRDLLTPEEHGKYVVDLEREILESIRGRSWFNILHLHGVNVFIEPYLDLPAQAINWHDQDDGPSLAAVRAMTDRCLMGGIGHLGVLLKGRPEDVDAQIKSAWKQVDGLGLILAPGCGANTRTPRENLLQIRQTVARMGV